MFYSHEILQKRGKFGIIWLAATSRQRLTRRDYYGVDVPVSSDDIRSIIFRHVTIEQQKKMRFSLYLSSQLMYGLSYVHGKQCSMLLDEVKHLVASLSIFKRLDSAPIDLEVPVSKFKVTFEPPDMSEAPLDFGFLKPLPEPSHHSYDYFLVTTPRSSEEEWIVSPGMHDDHLRIEPLPEGFESIHTADRSNVTMPEPPVESEEPIPEMVQEDNADLFTEDHSVLDSNLRAQREPAVAPDIGSMPTPEAEAPDTPVTADRPPPPSTAPVPPTGRDVAAHPSLPTPQVFPPGIDGAAHPNPPTPPVLPPGRDETAHPSPPARQRRALFDDGDTPLSPVRGRATRRPRRRRPIIDREIRLPAAEIRNYTTAPVTHLTVPLGSRVAPLRYGQSASSLLTGLSKQRHEIPRRVADRVSGYRTLPVLTDYSTFFTDFEFEKTSEEARRHQVSPEEGNMIDMEVQRGPGQLEGTIDPSLSGLLRTSSLEVADLSSGTPLFPTKDNIISPLPVLQEDVLLEAEELIDEPVENMGTSIQRPSEPADLIDEPVDEHILEPLEEMEIQRPSNPVCVYSPVSPERMSPPSSYKSITYDLMETLNLVQEAVHESSEPNFTKFTAVIAKATRKSEARLFSDLLHLHARRFIVLQQIKRGEEIGIQLLRDESGTSES